MAAFEERKNVNRILSALHLFIHQSAAIVINAPVRGITTEARVSQGARVYFVALVVRPPRPGFYFHRRKRRSDCVTGDIVGAGDARVVAVHVALLLAHARGATFAQGRHLGEARHAERLPRLELVLALPTIRALRVPIVTVLPGRTQPRALRRRRPGRVAVGAPAA